MKILHISGARATGGAGIGARRIHESLRRRGVDSYIGGADPIDVDGAVDLFTPRMRAALKVGRTLVCRIAARFTHNSQRVQHSVNLIPTGLHRMLNSSDYDIIHFHWMNNEIMSISEMGRVTKPIVWTMHDMWPFSGSAHYNFLPAESSGAAKISRNRGEHVDSDMSAVIDRWTRTRKIRRWKGFRPTLVPVSCWLGEQASASGLLNGCHIQSIPNALDMDVFKPIDHVIARDILNLPHDKRIILFCATRPPYKNMEQLAEVFELFFEAVGMSDILLLAFGSTNATSGFKGMPLRHMGRLHDEQTLALLYSAADVTCVPSRMEAFGQTASESLACGTPVVAFRATGLMNIVDHYENGYLADPFNTADFCHGLCWVLGLASHSSLKGSDFSSPTSRAESAARAGDLSREARKKALESYSYQAVSSKYTELYRDVLEANRKEDDRRTA